MEYSTIIVTHVDDYCIVTLNRPAEMNALSEVMMNDIIACFETVNKDSSVKAVVLTGGDQVFCAGMDLKEMSAMPEGRVDDYFESISSCLKAVYMCRKPVVAAVGGIALGGGFNLATMCDIIVASEMAIFGHPELRFGLNPLFDPLRRIVGTAKAKEITLLGEPIGAMEALRIGLVNKVYPPRKFLDEACDLARSLSQRSAKALETVKRISDVSPRLDKASALEHEFEVSALLFSREERKEYMSKFLEELQSRKKKKKKKD